VCVLFLLFISWCLIYRKPPFWDEEENNLVTERKVPPTATAAHIAHYHRKTSRPTLCLHQQILECQIEYPDFVGEDAKDLIQRLLQPADKRLGAGAGLLFSFLAVVSTFVLSRSDGAKPIKEHPFFKSIDWRSLVVGIRKSQ